MTIYRFDKKEHNPSTLLKMRDTRRAPGNVPYIVDNLWEWKRPEEYPCRRTSVYASPSVQQAQSSGLADNGKVFRVEFAGSYKLCQVPRYEDSRKHPDCRKLRKLILKKLGPKWLGSDLSSKREFGELWIPCLSKEDMETIFDKTERLREFRDELFDEVSYWDDVKLINDISQPNSFNTKGEIFFEAKDGYYLREID